MYKVKESSLTDFIVLHDSYGILFVGKGFIMKRTIIFDLHGVLFKHAHSSHQGSFLPIEAGVKLLEDCLHHTLFACTNCPNGHVDTLNKEYPAVMSKFQGVVNSTVAQAKKPSLDIFLYAIKTYGLVPEETIFIDDQEDNVQSAQELGMVGIHAHDLGHVRRELIALGVLPA